jgi:hypothetical protein
LGNTSWGLQGIVQSQNKIFFTLAQNALSIGKLRESARLPMKNSNGDLLASFYIYEVEFISPGKTNKKSLSPALCSKCMEILLRITPAFKMSTELSVAQTFGIN